MKCSLFQQGTFNVILSELWDFYLSFSIFSIILHIELSRSECSTVW